MGNVQTPITSATYSHLSAGATSLPAIPHQNGDNISDASASLTGATNPSADTDGDLIFKYTEYPARTGSSFAISTPGSGPVPDLNVAPGPNGTAILSWSTNDPAVSCNTPPMLTIGT